MDIHLSGNFKTIKPSPLGGGGNGDHTMGEKLSLYTKMVRAGRRTYFFDVREAKNSKKFLIISESTPATDGTFNRSSVLIFQEDIENFLAAFSEARELIK